MALIRARTPMSFEALPTRTGATMPDRTALCRQRLELRVGDLLALEVLGHDVVVGLGRGLDQLVAARGDLGGQVRPGPGPRLSLPPCSW